MIKFIYYIIHTFTGCKDEDLDSGFRRKTLECKKCGRIHIDWSK